MRPGQDANADIAGNKDRESGETEDGVPQVERRLTPGERDRELGKIIRLARESRRYSIRRCAQLLNTSWRRFTAIEKGETPIYASELEELVYLLDIPPAVIYPQEQSRVRRLASTSIVHVVNAAPGQVVHIVISVAKASEADITEALRERRASRRRTKNSQQDLS
jgi:transcriptional regulator with XRE-family HTH domain